VSYHTLELQARNTGRTARMLNQACECAYRGDNVLVICANIQHQNNIMGRLRNYRTSKDKKHRDVVSIGEGTLTVVDSSDPSFNWRDLDYSGKPEAKVFVDHYTIANKYEVILNEYHKFDLEE